MGACAEGHSLKKESGTHNLYVLPPGYLKGRQERKSKGKEREREWGERRKGEKRKGEQERKDREG